MLAFRAHFFFISFIFCIFAVRSVLTFKQLIVIEYESIYFPWTGVSVRWYG